MFSELNESDCTRKFTIQRERASIIFIFRNISNLNYIMYICLVRNLLCQESKIPHKQMSNLLYSYCYQYLSSDRGIISMYK